ncbi:MAG: DnaD domain protein [Brevefilum sp.]|nr:DnaD domain protein [Brevefilum sp.]MDT8381516.1 DnaD domain protein [Brevefilum sp.]MDW7754450.1 DnaD domain protein [Brevefilum sp.]
MTPQSTKLFKGFKEDNLDLVRLPEPFFSQILPLINSITQVRLLLYFFWHIEQQENNIRFLEYSDLSSDPTLMAMIGNETTLREDLETLVSMDILLEAQLSGKKELIYFVNGPQGRAAVKTIEDGQWKNTDVERKPIQLTDQQPNIYGLYEENIGPITPLIAEILKEDEKTYPEAWIKEAIEIAVKRNVRNWKYVQAILDRWQNEGRGNEQNRRNDSQDPSRYRRSWLGKK